MKLRFILQSACHGRARARTKYRKQTASRQAYSRACTCSWSPRLRSPQLYGPGLSPALVFLPLQRGGRLVLCVGELAAWRGEPGEPIGRLQRQRGGRGGLGAGRDLSAVLNASGQAGSTEPNDLGSCKAPQPQFLPLPCKSCFLCSVFLKY